MHTNFSSAFFAFVAMGLFLDFYNWELDGDEVLTDSVGGFEHLLGEQNYFTSTRIKISFGLHVIGKEVTQIQAYNFESNSAVISQCHCIMYELHTTCTIIILASQA